ncbi:choline dehydrogenase-like flavoprotein [Rhizobium leguminosarum]|nr:choline dehydrogenase-like flavoprotein [Rhizobium leguminosarum]
MGEAGPFGTSPDGELNLHPGLYVVDGSILPDLSSKYVTMTIMANADRIAHRLAAMEAASALRNPLPLQALICGNASPANDRSGS